MNNIAEWYILSNKSDSGDLSIYKYTGTHEEAFKIMESYMLQTAANTRPGEITQIITSDDNGFICYSDEEHEDFRIVKVETVPNILDSFANLDANLDAIPENLNMDRFAVDYAVHDIGREEPEVNRDNSQFVVTNVQWDFDFDEVYEKLDNMTVETAAMATGCPVAKYANMSTSERHDWAYDCFRHNLKSLDEFFGLPDRIVVPAEITDEDDISDWLSDEYGFCHNGFTVEK